MLRTRQWLGKYRILGRIASGPLADVYRAQDTIQNIKVALKIPKADDATGHEEFLMLDGELIDCDGQVFKRGDYVHFQPGSKHSSTTPKGCTLLVILRGNNRTLRADELD